MLSDCSPLQEAWAPIAIADALERLSPDFFHEQVFPLMPCNCSALQNNDALKLLTTDLQQACCSSGTALP